MAEAEQRTQADREAAVGAMRILERDSWTCRECGHQPPEDSDERMFATLIGEDETNPDHYLTLCREHHEVAVEARHSQRQPDEQAASTESVGQTETRDVRQTPDHTQSKPADPLVRVNRGVDWVLLEMLALLPLAVALVFGGPFLIGGISILNPLRMFGSSSWPVPLHPEIEAIGATQYITDVLITAPIVIGVSMAVIVVATQITIWKEPQNGYVTRIIKWGWPKLKAQIWL